MSGNGEPMATEEPAEASPSSTRITFENVRIQTLSEDGGAKDKYPGEDNKIRVEYDPEVSASRSKQESLSFMIHMYSPLTYCFRRRACWSASWLPTRNACRNSSSRAL